MKKITAYKVFNPDWTGGGFQYEVGKTYTMKEKPELCSVGFHACEKVYDCFNYYDFNPKNKVAIVELFGDVVGVGEEKCASNKIKIVAEISWEKMLTLANTGIANTGIANTGDCNTGDWNTGNCNTGDWNTGNCNTGDCNTGNCNTGYCNTGNRNTGDWNTGNCNTGYFNTSTPENVRVFGIDVLRSDFEKFDKPDYLYFNLTFWVSELEMTDEEKSENKMFYVAGGYLKKLDYKIEFIKSFESASQNDKDKMWNCPNFNPQMFFEISGIDYYLKNKTNK